MDIYILPYYYYIFAITRNLPKHIKVFKISMEKVIYIINSSGGPLPYQLWVNLAKGQANLLGKMEEASLHLLEVCI